MEIQFPKLEKGKKLKIAVGHFLLFDCCNA